MKKSCTVQKKFRFSFWLLVSLAVLFSIFAVSCRFDTGDSDNSDRNIILAYLMMQEQKKQAAQSQAAQYATITGSISLPGGAVPSSLMEAVETAQANISQTASVDSAKSSSDTAAVSKNSSDSFTGIAGINTEISKSAIASQPVDLASSDAYTYYVKLFNSSGLEVPNDAAFSDGKSTFTLTLDFGTWSIESGIKKGEVVLYKSVTPPITLSTENSVFRQNFVLKPQQSSERTGTMELSMTVPSNITKATVALVSGDEERWIAGGFSEGKGEHALSISSGTVSLSGTGIPSGSYVVKLNFYDSADVLLYSTQQLINIYDGLETDKWFEPAASSSSNSTITTTGTFAVTEDIIKMFALTNFYVNSSVTTDGTGSFYSPAKSLEKVLNTINSTKIADTDYTIHITGTQTAANTMATSRCYVVPAGLKSLTIEGTTALASGLPQDVVNGNEKGTVIEAKSPLTLKNIKISGGKNTSGNGGGLYINSGISVTLESGALVGDTITPGEAATSSAYGNRAQCGGGIYNDGGSLTLKSGSFVSHNFAEPGTSDSSKGGGGILLSGSASLNIEDGAKIIYNGSDGRGGGVHISGNSQVTMEGGEINSNHADYFGGGVMFSIDSGSRSFNMSGGKINFNTVTATTYGWGAGGGGVFVDTGGTFTMSGNSEIKGNLSPYEGGGIRIAGSGIFDMQGGTVSENETTVTENGSLKPGGGIKVGVDAQFKIQGSSRIPYGGAIGKNDVYLTRDTSTTPIKQASITVSDSFTGESGVGDVATITPEGWTRNTAVLKASDAIITSDITNRFKITDGDFSINGQSDRLAAILSAPIYVAGQGTKGVDYFVCETGGDSSSSATGTKAHPYANLSQAFSSISGGGDAVIYIDGIVKGRTDVCVSDENCSSLKIKGASDATHPALDSNGRPVNALDRNLLGLAYEYDGTVFWVETTVPITFENLKITGGKSSRGGGAIFLNSGGSSVRLGDGVWITGNATDGSDTTSNAFGGGGVFVGHNTSLFIYGTALIGDMTSTVAPFSTAESSNLASGIGGGGIYNCGNLYIGYDGFKEDGTTLNEHPVEDGYGIRGNATTDAGGAIYNKKGTVKIASGTIAYNSALNTSSSKGGAIYIDETNGDVDVDMTGGKISGNKASFGGGGVYIAGGNFQMSSGTLVNNISSSSGKGGAVNLNGGTFKLSGNAYIPFTGTENTNDVYLADGKYITIAGDVSLPTGVTSGANMTITPSSWTRGKQILTADSASLIADNASRFATIDEDFEVSQSTKTGEGTKGIITAPIYVASTAASDSTRKVCQPGVTSDTRGTKSKPFATIQAAIAETNADFTTITIDGTIDAQTVTSSVSLPTGVTEVTLQGYKASATAASLAQINGGGTASALWLQKDGLTTIIKDLTVTNGNPEYYGGGIRIGNGTVKLTDGAVITGNSAQEKGGGVYVASAGKLFVYGSALIGDSTTSTITPTSEDNAANSAPYGGGIYSDGGAVYLGYSAWTSETDNTPAAITAGYGVRRNYATYSGGGIYTSSSSGNPNVYMQSGNVSYNASGSMGGGMLIGYNAKIQGGTISNNKSKNGGAIYDSANIGAVYISGSADISGNTATEKGGAVYVSTVGTLNVEGGTITGNGASVSGGAIYNENILQITGGTITGNTAATAGGAVYNAGTLNMSGSANLYTSSNAEKTNDIYLPSEKYITLTANLSGSGVVATITPSEWNRGTQVLAGSSFIGANYSRFKVSDTAFSVESHYASSTYTGRIDAPLYVSASGNDETGRGTSALPYKTIKTAAEQCWGGSTDLSTNGRTINIVGTVSGAAQEIPSTVTTSKATAITLKGTTTSAAIDRGLSSSSASATGSALTVNTAVPVTIQTLTIKGGNTTGNGGGINVATGTVKLADGAKVTDNKANENGGGVYVASGSKLFMYSSALIGESTGYTTYASSSNCANTAQSGGGIYSEGSVYLGYSAWSGTSGTTIALTGGVMHNYITGTGNPYGGGGIYCNSGSVTMASGNLSYNGMSTSSSNYVHGGGIYVYTGTFTMSGGTIARNRANCGGGVYVKDSTAKFTMTDGTIGDSSTTSLGSSNEAVDGGGIFVLNGTVNLTGGYVASNYALSTIGGGGGLRINDGTVTISNTFQYNSAYNYGGAIYNKKDGINVLGGTISNNTAKYGGGILSEDCSVTLKNATLESNTATTNGGAVYLSVSSAHKDVILQGSTTIPSSGANDNDVYLKHSGSYYARIVPYPASISDLGLTGSGIVATITPDSYTEGLQVASSKIGYGSSMYDSEIRRVAVTPQATQNWGIADDGKLKAIIGTMTKPSAVGDIVYKDGSASPSTLSSISDTQKASAIAVIFKVSESNIYGVGLKVIKNDTKGYKWASSDAVGYGVVSTGDDGESNFTTMSGLSDWSQRAAKYPAFYLVENYWQQDSTNLSSGTYKTGWYIPSWSEASYLRLNLYPTVGNVFSTIGTTYADPLEDAFWTSDQTSDDAYSNYALYINPEIGSSGFAKKDSEEYVVRAVRKF